MLAAICWTFTKNGTEYSRHSEDKMICSSCVVIADSWTSGHQGCLGWPGVDGKRDAVIGVDGRRCSPRCEILLGPPWW